LISFQGANATGNKSSLYYSGLNNGDSLGDPAGGGGIITLPVGEGMITGLLPVGSSLFIFHTRGIFRFSGFTADDMSVTALSTAQTGGVVGIQAVYPSYISLGNVGYFPGDNGYLHSIDEAGNVSIINPNGPFLYDVNGVKVVNGYGSAIYDRHRDTIVWLAGSTPDGIMYNVLTKTVTTHQINTGAGYNGTANPVYNLHIDFLLLCVGQNPCVYGGLNSANAYNTKDDLLADGTGGTEVVMTVTTRSFVFGKPLSMKAFKYLYITYKTQVQNPTGVTVNTVSCILDRGIGSTYRFGGVGTIVPNTDFNISFSESSIAGTERITAVAMDVYEYGDRF
jgi:hypothetical protein